MWTSVCYFFYHCAVVTKLDWGFVSFLEMCLRFLHFLGNRLLKECSFCTEKVYIRVWLCGGATPSSTGTGPPAAMFFLLRIALDSRAI